MNKVFDYVNRIWMDGDLFFVNGCDFCGIMETNHGIYLFCNRKGNKTGRYVRPNDTTILYRMKHNRMKKQTKKVTK